MIKFRTKIIYDYNFTDTKTLYHIIQTKLDDIKNQDGIFLRLSSYIPNKLKFYVKKEKKNDIYFL